MISQLYKYGLYNLSIYSGTVAFQSLRLQKQNNMAKIISTALFRSNLN